MDTPLGDWIRARIEENGPVPFADFMEWALYHPEHGYYSSGRVRVGEDGADFITSPHVSTLFSRCLARLVRAADRALGHPTVFHLVEGGPGEGRLARDLLDALAEEDGSLYERIAYTPDERSPALLERQREALVSHRNRIRGIEEVRAVAGLYLSNELLDAFPFHRVRRVGGELLEVHVALQEGRLAEILCPPSRGDLVSLLDRGGVELPEGCEAEVRPSVARWLEHVGAILEKGYLLTIDYGGEGARLYGAHAPRGTSLAFRGQRASEDLLARPGEQDLTAHVNFTLLRRHGETLGFDSAPLLTQRDLLIALGILEEAQSLERLGLSEPQLIEARRALAPLLFPGDAMGETFKALLQSKNATLSALPLDPNRPPGADGVSRAARADGGGVQGQDAPPPA